jgi:hypothetical protein
MSKLKKIVIVGDGEICPKCSTPMERRKHRTLSESILNQPYYFSEWDYCKPCGHLQHYDKYKVYSTSEMREYFESLKEMNGLFDSMKNF